MAELSPEAAQKAVDQMTLALAHAERDLQKAIISICALPAAIKDFHYAIGTHVTTSLVQDAIGNSTSAAEEAAGALRSISYAHDRLNDLRMLKNLPEPELVALNGGGNGKP